MSSEEFKSLVSNNSNLEEVRDYISSDKGGPNIEHAVLLNTLDSCLALLMQNNLHVSEHVSLIETLREANAELKSLVATSQSRMEQFMQDNVENDTTDDMKALHAMVLENYAKANVSRNELREQIVVLNERIRVNKADYEVTNRANDLTIDRLRQMV
jgi:hypothetical protein|tara:strand:- start:520 stop:990 length:471 start_codon:yes stop_codon:yes gene_type:complete